MNHVLTPFRSLYGSGIFHCFSFGTHEEDNILVIEAPGYEKTGLVRVQSACYTAEIFRSTDCDCHQQLESSLEQIFKEGGLVIYMLCDGRGAGLLTKVRAVQMWEDLKIDTHDAYQKMGVIPDPRTYDRLKDIVEYFKLLHVKLLTNNPRKIDGLAKLGLTVTREPLIVKCHADAKEYLETKKNKMGHLLP